MYLLARLIANIKFAVHDELHLMISIRVDKRGASLKSVESATYGLLGIQMVTVEPAHKRKRQLLR